MLLNASSFVVRGAYWHRVVDKQPIPERTSLCSLWWKFVLNGLILRPVVWVVMWVVMFMGGRWLSTNWEYQPIKGWPRIMGARITLLHVILFPFPFLILGERPGRVFESDSDAWIQPLGWWPYKRVAPLAIILIGCILALILFLFWVFGSSIVNGIRNTDPNVNTLWVVGGISGVLLLVILDLIRTSEIWFVTKEFIRAKKQKVCPIVFITNDLYEIEAKEEV